MEPIKISCLGDLMPGDTTYTLGKGIGSNISRLTEHYSKKNTNPFNSADIRICNLEAPLLINQGINNLPFAGNPDVVKLLKIFNITIVSTANNHILDHGHEGLEQTIEFITDYGFVQIGSKVGNISRIAWLELKGRKFAFAAFNAIHDFCETSLVAPLEKEILFDTLVEIKKHSPDYTIFSVHWGNEYITYPSPAQVDLAHELIDCGVNIIIGHHPHVVQPVEKYHGGIILYSLGNFLFDMLWSEKVRNGMEVELILFADRSMHFQVKAFRIRSDFTLEYPETNVVYSILDKSGKKLELLQKGPRKAFQKEYLREYKKNRFYARVKMKLYLLTRLFKLSPQSRELFFSNLITKSRGIWKGN